MKNVAPDVKVPDSTEVGIAEAAARDQGAEMGRIPGVSIHAFCDSVDTLSKIETLATDRRMSRTQLSPHAGGLVAAESFYQQTPTPDLIVIESQDPAQELLANLDRLAMVCDISTRILIIGRSNDIGLYRELMDRGVSEYLLYPAGPMQIIAAISRIYGAQGEAKLGKVYAFIGAKGGVGSSTVAHNVAWCIGERFKSKVLLADLDMAFGTAGLNYDQEPVKGVYDAVDSNDRLDEAMLERLVVRCSDTVNLLTAPTLLDRTYDFDENAFDHLIDLARGNFPYIILDLPNLWTAWAKRAMYIADELVITAAPDLPSLTGAKHLVECMAKIRPLDAPPRLVLNHVGVPKRPEIKLKKFVDTLQLEPACSIASDPKLFGEAENTGQLVTMSHPKSKTAITFNELAQTVSGRKKLKKAARGGLASLFRRRRPAKGVPEKGSDKGGFGHAA